MVRKRVVLSISAISQETSGLTSSKDGNFLLSF